MNKRLLWSIAAIVFGRLVINIARRFPYPFVSAIGASFSVPATSIQNVIALTNGAGLLSPILGTISAHYGRKATMVGVLLMMAGVSVLGALFADYGVFVLVMFALGIGKIIYDPTIQAYFGDTIHFSRRARVMGVAELSWALSLLIAAPVAGYLLDSSSLQAVFLFLAFMLALGALTIYLVVESDARPDHDYRRLRIINPIEAMRAVSAHPPAVAALAYSLCLTLSHEIFFINYGLWMEDAFGLLLTALGAITIVIAIAEVIGEFIVISIADRIGAKQTSMYGMLVAAFCFLIIPYLTFSLPLAMFGIFVMFISIEAAIVSALPLFTEIMPKSRAIMMSANMGAHSLGRVCGAALGGLIYAVTGGDFAVIGIVAAALGFVAVVVMKRFVPAHGAWS